MFPRIQSHTVFTLTIALILLAASMEFRPGSSASASQNLPSGVTTTFKKMCFAPEAQRILAGDEINGRRSPPAFNPGRRVRPE